MRTCSIFVSGSSIIALPMIKTRDGWERYVSPAVLIGEEAALSNDHLGGSVITVLGMHRTGVPDEEATTDNLNRSVKQLGFKSYRAFFRQCLQMSIEETPQGYKLTPYERVHQRGTEGAVPLDMAITANTSAEDLGRAIREGISYCR